MSHILNSRYMLKRHKAASLTAQAARSTLHVFALVSFCCGRVLQGLSSGCRLAIQALVAVVAVGELALCSPPPGAIKPAQAGDRGAPPLRSAAASSDGAAPAAAALVQAADGAAAAAAAGGREPAAAAPAATSEAAESAILRQLLLCSLVLGGEAKRISSDTAEAWAAEIAAIEADDLAAGKSGVAAAGSKQRRAGNRAVKAEVRAAQAASARLLVTAAAGLAGLTSVAAAAVLSERAQRAAGATGQPRDKASVARRVAEKRAMASLLQQSAKMAMQTLEAAHSKPDIAADLIEVLLVFVLLLQCRCLHVDCNRQAY
jgi:hypothetical protein